jgi:acrylyl-CoA reductase (NADPH)
MDGFKAYRIHNENNKIAGRLDRIGLADLGPGEVVFRTAYSGVNYKDALACTGSGGKIIRRYPLVGGIDAAGTVVTSTDPRFEPGQKVICTSYDMGVAHDGGYAQYCRVPADWVVPLPEGLSLFESMVLGTAGYTAGLAIDMLELNGLAPANGPVLINGATGGVSTILIDILSGLGYRVTAVTGKDAEHDYLRQLGAAEILPRAELDYGTRPLEKARWAAAFDSIGGEQLTWLTRTMDTHGLIASIGNAGGIAFSTTVLPFILRGVRLIGVDSALTPMPHRSKVWHRLATDLKPRHMDRIATRMGLADLPDYFRRMLEGGIRGRGVVDLQQT